MLLTTSVNEVQLRDDGRALLAVLVRVRGCTMQNQLLCVSETLGHQLVPEVTRQSYFAFMPEYVAKRKEQYAFKK